MSQDIQSPNAACIPFLNDIKIDGDPSDWSDRGLRIGAMKTFYGRVRSPQDFYPTLRLGWNNDGLLLLAVVHDDMVVEAEDGQPIGSGDSLEVWICGSQGPRHLYHAAIAPGAGSKPRISFTDDRMNRENLPDLQAEVASRVTDAGYIIEVMLPWSNLGITAEEGTDIGLMVAVSDVDGAPQSQSRVFWNPMWLIVHTAYMQGARLSSEPSDQVLALASAYYEQYRRVRVDVRTDREIAGRTLTLRDGDKVLGEATVSDAVGAGEACFRVPIPPVGQPYGELSVFDGEILLCKTALPGNRDLLEGRALVDANFRFEPSVFHSNTFPVCDFEHPHLAEKILGPYTIRTTFYDNHYREVKTAGKPGRYGAVAEIIPENGTPIKRFRTLFRLPDAVSCRWRAIDITGSYDNFKVFGFTVPESEWSDVTIPPELPSVMGINPDVVEQESAVISRCYKRHFARGLTVDPIAAPMLVGMYERSQGDALSDMDLLTVDRQWWVGLKRKLRSSDDAQTDVFICPRPVKDPTPVLRDGSPEDAGVADDAYERIDSVCRQWDADSDQGFAVLVARHGVIVIHKAYGMRDDRPMTVNDRSWMASITKTLSSNLMWMMVDQGLVDLDAPIEKYLPSLRGIRTAEPVLVRHLHTHMAGFLEAEHWGDELNDLEEILVSYYPHLQMPALPAYNGISFAISGKIIEAITGESVPVFFKNHLLDPLGCTNTVVVGTHADAESIPMDIGRIAQMMLNRGSYGDRQFYRPETLDLMLPPAQDAELPVGIPAYPFGIGVTGFPGEGLGEGTFGHGAASSAILRIDPVNDLIVVMTRNTAGTNYDRYHLRFMNAVAGGLKR